MGAAREKQANKGLVTWTPPIFHAIGFTRRQHGPHLYRVVDLYQVMCVTRSLPPKAFGA
jgi:hypothetical protein